MKQKLQSTDLELLGICLEHAICQPVLGTDAEHTVAVVFISYVGKGSDGSPGCEPREIAGVSLQVTTFNDDKTHLVGAVAQAVVGVKGEATFDRSHDGIDAIVDATWELLKIPLWDFTCTQIRGLAAGLAKPAVTLPPLPEGVEVLRAADVVPSEVQDSANSAK